MANHLKIITLRGKAILPYVNDLAHLRIQVFKEYPYLYDGNLAYEKKYLQTYIDCVESGMVIVLDNQHVAGASTAIPLCSGFAEVQEPFVKNNLNVKEFFYYGESVLLPAYRGQGIGKQFFSERDKMARANHCRYATFCAVERDPADPRRPADYHSLEKLWRSQGFEKHPELQLQFSWKEHDEATESPKTMIFWVKQL